MLDHPKIYISNDGPKSKEDAKKVTQVRNFLIDSFKDNQNVFFKFQSTNKGCKLCNEEAISWFFGKEEEGIVLEDDCIPNKTFFKFCDTLLEKYRSDNRIWLISGTNVSETSYSDSSYFFSNLGGIHGWASWRRCWSKYISDYDGFQKYIENKAMFSQFENKVGLKRINQFKRVDKYKISSWAYSWGFTRNFYNGLSIIPSVNLINNIGYNSQESTHNFGKNNNYVSSKDMKFPLIHPNGVFPNSTYDIEAIKEKNVLMKVINIFRNHKTPLVYLLKKTKQYLSL